jgi:hypothetical protein
MAKKTRAAKKATRKPSGARKLKKAKKPSVRRRPSSQPAPAAPVLVTREMVAKRAYEIWMGKSRVAHSNHPVQNWLEAEAELLGSSGK